MFLSYTRKFRTDEPLSTPTPPKKVHIHPTMLLKDVSIFFFEHVLCSLLKFFIHIVTSWSRDTDKLIVAQLHKSSTFYETWSFITMFTITCHWSLLSQMNLIHTHLHLGLPLRLNILSAHCSQMKTLWQTLYKTENSPQPKFILAFWTRHRNCYESTWNKRKLTWKQKTNRRLNGKYCWYFSFYCSLAGSSVLIVAKWGQEAEEGQWHWEIQVSPHIVTSIHVLKFHSEEYSELLVKWLLLYNGQPCNWGL
jgi:hypothetical protein